MTKELRNEIKFVLSAIFTALAIAGLIHIFTFEGKMSKAFENGYNQAILDAELVSIDGNEYIISFNGEEHIYTK